jgi:hypothetical protein
VIFGDVTQCRTSPCALRDSLRFLPPVNLPTLVPRCGRKECEVPDRLRHVQWVHFFEKNGYDRLLRALRARAEAIGIN